MKIKDLNSTKIRLNNKILDCAMKKKNKNESVTVYLNRILEEMIANEQQKIV